jgi:hypothetical protein
VSFKVIEEEDDCEEVEEENGDVGDVDNVDDVGDVDDAPTALSVVGCLPIATHWVAPHVVHPSGR